MKKYLLSLMILLAVAVLLQACSGAQATTQVPIAAIQAGGNPSQATSYPAPGVVGQAAPGKAGYPAPGAAVQSPPGQAAYPAPGAGVLVMTADGKSKTIATSAINAIAKAKASVNGTAMDVRKLTDLLAAAGVTPGAQTTVSGANGNLALSAEQLSKAYLDVAADGLVKLVVDGVQPDKWITSVVKVTVQ
jgi:hypothetical protein